MKVKTKKYLCNAAILFVCNFMLWFFVGGGAHDAVLLTFAYLFTLSIL